MVGETEGTLTVYRSVAEARTEGEADLWVVTITSLSDFQFLNFP